MPLLRRTLISGSVTVCLLGGFVHAAEHESIAADQWVRESLERGGSDIHVAATIEDIKKGLQYLFDLADFDGGGVSANDNVLRQQRNRAQVRSRFMARWVDADLDGDRNLTRAELETVYLGSSHRAGSSAGKKRTEARKRAEKRQRAVNDMLKADRNQDDVVTLDEAFAEAEDRALKDRRANRPPTVTIPPSFDTDGDGVVSQEEFDEHVDRALRAIDKDGDGTLSRKELTAWKEGAAVERERTRATSEAPDVLAPFDDDGDGVLSEKEFEENSDQLRRAFDTDGDGGLSAQELAVLQEALERSSKIADARRRGQRKEAEGRKLAAACGIPRAPEGARIVLLGAYGGQALSTVGLGGDDKVVKVADVLIEPGSEPLYVLLSSYSPMIWRFGGAVERITVLTANSQTRDANGTPRVGVLGLPENRVFIAKQTKCLRGHSGTRMAKAVDSVLYMLGRDVDAVFAHYKVSLVHLPSGRFETQTAYAGTVKAPESDHAAALWRRMIERHPGSVVRIDASAVVSRTAAEDYATWPEHAGLAQLVSEGALQVLGTARMVGGTTSSSYALPNRFVILKKIRFPAGLRDSGIFEFVLAPGVPKPDRSPGQPRYVEEER